MNTKINQKLAKTVLYKLFFFARRATKPSVEGRSPPQELEVVPHSGPYLLVIVMVKRPVSGNLYLLILRP